MDRLKREGNPPVGQLASPVPQYKDAVLNDWAELQGEGGASYVKDRDALAKLEQVKSELELVKAELATIKANQLSGDQKVQLSGTIVLLNAITASTTITAGSTVQVYSGNLEELAVKEINVQWYCLSSLDMRVRISYYRNSNYTAAAYGTQYIEEVSGTHSSLGKWVGVVGPYFVVGLQNRSDKDVTLASAHVVGRLG